jgi:hypothetical protein
LEATENCPMAVCKPTKVGVDHSRHIRLDLPQE